MKHLKNSSKYAATLYYERLITDNYVCLVTFQDSKTQEYYLGRMEPKVLDEKPPGMELIKTVSYGSAFFYS